MATAKSTPSTREQRGFELYRRGGIERIDRRGLYMVPSCSHRGEYLVDLERQSCECPDSRRGYVCKHVYAAMLYAAWIRRAARTVATSGAFDA